MLMILSRCLTLLLSEVIILEYDTSYRKVTFRYFAAVKNLMGVRTVKRLRLSARDNE